MYFYFSDTRIESWMKNGEYEDLCNPVFGPLCFSRYAMWQCARKSWRPLSKLLQMEIR